MFTSNTNGDDKAITRSLHQVETGMLCQQDAATPLELDVIILL